MPIRFVCFDIGGVLVRHCRSWTEGCAAAGLPVRDGCESQEMTARRRELARHLTMGVLEEDDFYQRIAQLSPGLYSADEVRRIHTAWLGEEYEGVYPVIADLVSTGIPTAILSNTNAPHWRALADARRYPTPNLIPHRHASHLLRMAKPDPAIFEACQRQIGAAPAEILFLEDLAENIAAARAAGWQVAPIDHTRETAPQIRDALQRHQLL